MRSLVVRGMLKSGRSADDVLACLHLGVTDTVAAISDNLRLT